jgi:NADH-quinone oxidoreductase subunit G
VGALTHRPWAFNYRPWELRKSEGIDVMDALGSSIWIQARGDEVMRILPRPHDAVNEEWLSDKSRYIPDGLMRQRLDRPYVRRGGRLQEASWAEAFAAVADRVRATRPERIGVIAGDLQDAESMKAALDLFTALGVPNLDCRPDGSQLGGGERGGYLFNSTIAGIERADAILLVGSNPRLEAPVLNARIRKSWGTTNLGLRVGVIGAAADLTYPSEHLGTGTPAFGSLGGFVDVMRNAERPAVIVGPAAYARPDGGAVLRAAARLAQSFNVVREGWNGFNVMHTAAGRVAGLDLGFLPRAGGKTAVQMTEPDGVDLLFLMGADELPPGPMGDTFVVYMGTHGDAGAQRADIILPAAAYTEKNGTYVNLEGRVQLSGQAVHPKGDAKEDWTILRALSEVIGAKLPYDTLGELRARLIGEHPTFGQVDYVAPAGAFDLSQVGTDGQVSDRPFEHPITDYYQTNPIARASVTMAECSAVRSGARPLMAAE